MRRAFSTSRHVVNGSATKAWISVLNSPMVDSMSALSSASPTARAAGRTAGTAGQVDVLDEPLEERQELVLLSLGQRRVERLGGRAHRLVRSRR